MDSKLLDDGEISQALVELNGWERDEGALLRTFTFADFRAAMAFMVRAGFEVDAANHHPDWSNLYNRVVVRLSTHDAGDKITVKDVALAKAFDAIAD
jgi:4a-hydroxytetrahydrobiopterin dehydratase